MLEDFSNMWWSSGRYEAISAQYNQKLKFIIGISSNEVFAAVERCLIFFFFVDLEPHIVIVSFRRQSGVIRRELLRQ